MILKANFRLLFVLAALAIAANVFAAPLTITHQGRLLDSNDEPVADGFYGATFSLWDDPVAGNQVWSELQDIETKSGLFSVELGTVSSFFDIFTEFADQGLFLQVQVQVGGGLQTLEPRMPIGTVPFASVSKRVHAIHHGAELSSRCDVSATDSGAVVALDIDADNDGTPERRFQTLSNASKVATVLVADLDDDGLADRKVSEDCDDTDASVSLLSRAPGGGGGGGGAGGSVFLSAADLSSSVSLTADLDGDGLADRRVDEDCDDTDAAVSVSSSSSLDGNSQVVCSSSPPSSSVLVARDLDRDGALDLVVSSTCDATGAKHAINTKGTGAQGGRVASVSSSTSDAGATFTCQLDMDGDAVPDRGIDDDCDDFSSSRSMSFFDVFTETMIDDDCDATGARRRLSSGNLGSSGQDGVSVEMRCDPDSAIGSTEVRKSGSIISADYSRHTPFHNSRRSSFFDVFTEMTIDQDCDATGARLAINSKGTSAKRTVACSTDASSSSVVATGDLDGDGLDDSEAALRISPTTSSLAIKTKGTGAQRLSGGRDCDDTDVRDYLDSDDDGDGLAESSVSSSSSSSGSDLSLSSRLGGGMPNRISMNMTVGKQTQSASFGSRCFVDGDDDPESEVSHSITPTTSSVAIKTKGTGADANRSSVSSSSSPSSSSLVCDQDYNGDGIPDVVISSEASSSRSELTGHFETGDVPTESDFATTLDASGGHHVLSGMSGSTTATIRMAATPDSTVFDLGYHGSTTGTIRLMASSSGSDNPIEHSSGAHLTPGGLWTNASDENLKENFQPVDGEEILEKIEQLPISQWNYKNESDEVTHIGPTAQDFKKTFGVGENDKSISTIDPSGIALVAVKELRKENQELKAQVEELKKMVEELAKKK